MHTAVIPPDTPLIRGLHSLYPEHAEATRQVLLAEAPDWQLDRHETCDGNLMLLLTPPGPEETTPCFVLQGAQAGIQLAVTRADRYRDVAVFQTVRQAVRHARQMLQEERLAAPASAA